jgi:hypothetical protein
MALAKRGFHSTCQLLKRTTNHLVSKDNKKFKLVSFPEPPTLTPSVIADATKLFARPVSFIQSISKADQAPDLAKPEVIDLRNSLKTIILIEYNTIGSFCWKE